MKRSIRIILLLAALICLSGCVSKFKQIKITSVSLESVNPVGLKNYDAVVALGIDNPAPSFNIMNLNADVRRDTVPVIHLKGENVAVAGRSSKVYRVPVSVQIDSAVSLLRLAVLARNFKAEDYKVDLSARAVVGGVGKNLSFTDLSLADLMQKANR